jgi:XRE family transcriptional regulator, regulator of sulfur utilization
MIARAPARGKRQRRRCAADALSPGFWQTAPMARANSASVKDTRTHGEVVPDTPEQGPNVGENLRLLRTERGLSLADLAERSGVSRAMLNQIETGKSSPTIALGWKIANGLGVSFGALLGEAEPADFVVQRSGELSTFFSTGRALRSRALFPSGDPRAAELYELVLEPGAEERAHSHAVGTREQIYLHEGQLVIETGGRSAELGAGDLIFFRADRPHRYLNPGRAPARFFLVMRYPEAAARVPKPAS